ncbi:MAG: DUF5312 family protein [Treponema sp.]|nr:DUF5312 family protein [Treponema sp.]
MGNFFQKLFASLFNSSDPEALKKKELKNIAKTLAKSHYNYYKFSSDEVEPALAKLFFQIYKAISPSQIMFQSMQNKNALKTMIVTRTFSEKEAELYEQLSEENIRAKAKSVSYNVLSENVNTTLEAFLNSFDAEKTNKLNNLYINITAFQAFCTFDYYFFLKKFDSSLKERDFNATPRFDSINGDYIKEDLKDFVAVAWALQKDADWTTMLSFFKEVKGVEPIAMKTWTQILTKLSNIRRSHALEMVLKLACKDPSFEPQVTMPSGNVVEPFIDKVKNDALNVLTKLKSEQKASKVDKIVDQLFGSDVGMRLKNYTDDVNQDFAKHQLSQYEYVEPLNFLKAFLLDIFKTEMREYSDLILVRGQWATAALSAQMSEAYNELLEISNNITSFDQKLAEDGEIGIKIKTHMPSSMRSKEAANILETLIEDANDEAKGYIISAVRDLISIGKILKPLLEDYVKQPKSEMIMNWKELEKYADHPIKDQGVNLYKKIYLLVQLIQSYIGGNQ